MLHVLVCVTHVIIYNTLAEILCGKFLGVFAKYLPHKIATYGRCELKPGIIPRALGMVYPTTASIIVYFSV